MTDTERDRLVEVQSTSAMWTPKEAGKLLANRVTQPHYVESIIRKCIWHVVGSPGKILRDAMRYRKLRHYLSPRVTSQVLMQSETMRPQDGWSTEDWTDAIVDSVEAPRAMKGRE